MFLFPSRTILLQLQVIIFQEQIFKRYSLGAKEREIGADSCQKYKDLILKYLVQRIEDLVQKYIKWRARIALLLFLLLQQSCLF